MGTRVAVGWMVAVGTAVRIAGVSDGAGDGVLVVGDSAQAVAIAHKQRRNRCLPDWVMVE